MTTKNIHDLEDTWDHGAIEFTAIKMDVTDTASAAGSKLIDLQVGGVSKFKVDKDGNLTLDGDITSNASVYYSSGGTDVPVADGGTGASTAAAARTSLGLAIGTNVQAYSARLGEVSALAVTDGNIIVANGAGWVAESGATARTSLGVGTGASPQFSGVNIGHATDTTLARASAGQINVEGVQVATASNTLTLTNKTLTTPTINGAALSGSISGTPNFTGNVGVGTASPGAKLEVSRLGGAYTKPTLAVATAFVLHPGIENSASSGGITILGGVTSSPSINFGDSDAESMGAIIYRNADDSMALSADGSERVRITSAGNVGIGTASPTTKLHVNGPIRHLTYTVATLPAAGTVGAGTRAAVTDANATTFNSTVASGGANFVPVISNGTNWLIG